MTTERRKQERYEPQDVTFVAMRPDFTRLGKLLDISRGGLCFQYMAKEYQNVATPSSDIDIFTSGSEYYLPGVPCKVIYDADVTKKMASFIDVKYRRCGLKFLNLSQEQVNQLDSYLKTHTAAAA